MSLKESQRSLRKWEKEEWGTKSGKPSSETGRDISRRKRLQRYLQKNTQEQQKQNEKEPSVVDSSLSNLKQ